MKSVTLVILSTLILMLSSCKNSTNQSNQDSGDTKGSVESIEVESIKRYEIELTMDNYFEYEHLNENQLIKYSMTIVYPMLRNKQYVTTNYLITIFPNFNKKQCLRWYQN